MIFDLYRSIVVLSIQDFLLEKNLACIVTMKNTKTKRETTTKKETKPSKANNNKSNYGYTVTKEIKNKENENNLMNSDRLTGSKLIETASKMLARKHRSISKDTWRKEAFDLYEHNERFDGELVSLDWFMTKLEDLIAVKYGRKSDAKANEGEYDLQSFLEAKKRNDL